MLDLKIDLLYIIIYNKLIYNIIIIYTFFVLPRDQTFFASCRMCLFLNKVDYFKALFFNTCLPILKRLTRSPGNA